MYKIEKFLRIKKLQPVVCCLRCKVNGMSEDFQLPFFDFVGQDPTLEEMKAVVCDKQIRPTCPNRWQSSEVKRPGAN